MRSVTGSRWQEAQVAEQEYWRPEHFAIAGFLETAVPQALTASWAAARIPKLPGSPWLELGIGPLGVGCMHFLPGSDGRTLFAADTLKRIPADEWQLPTALRVVV